MNFDIDNKIEFICGLSSIIICISLFIYNIVKRNKPFLEAFMEMLKDVFATVPIVISFIFGSVFLTSSVSGESDRIKSAMSTMVENTNTSSDDKPVFLDISGNYPILEPDSGYQYELKQLCDGKVETCWAEGIDGNGIGAEIKFYNNEDNIEKVHAIYINNGNCRNEDMFYKNAHVKQIKLEFSGRTNKIVDFEYEFEKNKAYRIDLSNNTNKGYVETSFVKITVIDVYDGTKWDDLSISDIWFE
ncbi:MAG: hypothetical protein IJZ64_01635 [Ruminococcus sp.]|nr:hypothetical protein [Ruminococcus sp.]